MRTRFFLLLGVVIMASCFNEKDYDFKNVTLTPTFAFPIAFGDVGLMNLLSAEDSSYVRSYPDGLLYFYYTQTLDSKAIHDLFSLPDNSSTTTFNLPAGTLPASSSSVTFGSINRQIDLSLSPEQLSEILLKGGTLNYSVSLSQTTSPPNLPIEATITLTDVVHKTTLAPLTVTLSSGSGTQPLQDHVIQLINNRFNIRIDLVIKPHPATFIPSGTTANIQLTMAGMEFRYIKGFLGDQITQLPPQTIDISVFGSSLNNAGVSFVEPKLTMNVVNDYGASCEVNFSVLRAVKDATSLPIQITPSNPVNLNFPTVMGQSATTDVTITNEQAILNFGPEKLEYTASARINKGLSNAINFLTDTSKLSVTMATEIPIYGKVSGVTVLDTMEVDLGEVTESKVSSSSLKINATNEMPMDAYIQIYLADETYHIIDSIFAPNQTYIVRASTVDAAGDLQSPGISDFNVGLDPEKVSKLFDSKYLIVKAVMSTGRDGNGAQLNVKFRAAYRLKLHIGLLTKFNITLELE